MARTAAALTEGPELRHVDFAVRAQLRRDLADDDVHQLTGAAFVKTGYMRGDGGCKSISRKAVHGDPIGRWYQF